MKRIFLLIVILVPLCTFAQNSDESTDLGTSNEKTYESSVFSTSRIINGHSIEQMKAKQLDFRISHRFGQVNSGAYNFFGLDQASIHLSLEYGLTDWLMFGIGRSNVKKTFDGFVKLKLLRQTSGSNSMPIFVSYMGSTELFTSKWLDTSRDNLFSSRLTYVHQLLIARKFSEKLSLQLSPTVVHKNLTPTELDPNDLFALGAGGRLKISNEISINAEYYYAFRSSRSSVDYPNAFSVGIDIDTGGHVFQIMLTNSLSMREGGFIWGENNGDWTNGGIHLGFNISRVFNFDRYGYWVD